MLPSDPAALCAALAAALASSPWTAALPGPEGFRLAGVAPRFLSGKDVPVVALERPGATLCFIVTPTDPAQPAYKRSRRLDLVYFSEDVADGEQALTYARDRATIDRFAAWLAAWDAAAA